MFAVGYFIGHMLDPLVWAIAAISAWVFKGPWYWRLAIGIALMLLIAFTISEWHKREYGPSSPGQFLFASLATAAWFGIFMGIRSLIARRRAAKN